MTLFPYTTLFRSGKCKLEQLINWMTIQPAKLFGLNRAGMLRIGDAADIAIFDCDHAFKFREEDYLSKGRNTPFTNQQLYGQTVMIIVDGEIKYQREKEH